MATIPDEFLDFFKNEVGIHVWQDYDKGRVQTCTFMVGVVTDQKASVDLSGVTTTYTRASGNGGQNRNKVETCVVMVDEKTGLRVRYAGQRTRSQNEKIAKKLLMEKLSKQACDTQSFVTNQNRLEQLNPEKGRRRTYKLKDGIIIDHKTGKKSPVGVLFKAKFNEL